MDFIDLLRYGFIQRALIAGSVIALVCALLGVVLVLRRLSLIGDGLSHVTFGTVALAMVLNLYPLVVALPVVLICSLGILRMTEKAGIFGDAAIGVVSSVGIACGILLASVSGGFTVDLFSYLFGNILSIGTAEVAAALIICAAVLASIYVYFEELFSITFDEEFARASGIPVDRINAVLMALTAVTIVLAMKVVGIMLTSALLVLPAVTAFQNAGGFRNAMLIAALLSLLALLSGIVISFVWDLPPGAMIVMINFIFFVCSFLFRQLTRGRAR